MRFSQKVTKMRAQARTKKNLNNNGLMTGALLRVISDIHRVCTNLEDLMMSEINLRKVPILKPLVLQILLYRLELSFGFLFEKT